MNAFGSKLSKHVLGMKFMRRTKSQVDKDKTESKFRQHFAKSSSEPAEAKNSNLRSCEIQEVGSYSQCEGHAFGRQSFGGFNPVLEANVKKGIWKPFYLEPEDEDEVDKASADEQLESDEAEMEVSDKEMAKTFGSLVGTLGKKFLKKKDRGKTKVKTEPHSSPNKKEQNDDHKKKKRWGRRGGSKTKDNHREEESEEPPNKKLRFMRPSD